MIVGGKIPIYEGLAPHEVLAPGATVTVAKNAKVVDANGKEIGRIVSGQVKEGDVAVVMEINDGVVTLLNQSSGDYSIA